MAALSHKFWQKGVFPFPWKFGRSLLASSHAGTRLPIAAIQGTGRSPSARRGLTANAVCHILSKKVILKQNKKETLKNASLFQSYIPTAALSTSGIRVEGFTFLSACHTSSPVICSPILQQKPILVNLIRSLSYNQVKKSKHNRHSNNGH